MEDSKINYQKITPYTTARGNNDNRKYSYSADKDDFIKKSESRSAAVTTKQPLLKQESFRNGSPKTENNKGVEETEGSGSCSSCCNGCCFCVAGICRCCGACVEICGALLSI